MRKFFYLACAIILFVILQKIDWSSSPQNGCPFCDPANVAKYRVLPGTHASAVATYKPAVPGHLLIIPNRHVQTFDLLEPQEVTEMASLIKRVHQIYVDRFQATDYVLIQKNGPLAGQSVPHVHIHMLPRTKDRGMVNLITHFLTCALFKPMNDKETRDYLELF